MAPAARLERGWSRVNWETVIGLETHVELATKTKMFCACAASFGGRPNTRCCPVCMGLPGALPVLNERAVEHAVRAGLALGCQIDLHSRFDRKNYFYPDLPKGYQISQLYRPLGRNGSVRVGMEDGSEKVVSIHEVHMEEDAGKLIHDPVGGKTRVDYNRCGIPLIEIVTEPVFSNGDEVVAYLEELRTILRYLGVSDGRLEEGSLRCDVNLSVRPAGSGQLGVRTEMKNLGSFRAVRLAVEYESQRQIALLESGGTVVQETRRWDEDANRSISMRSKEDARDYRYVPEPDLPEVTLTQDYLGALRIRQPELAGEKRRRYRQEYGLSDYDARMLTGQRALAEWFEQTVALGADAKTTANWILGQVLRQLKQRDMDAAAMPLRPEQMACILAMVDQGLINRGTGVQVLDAVFEGGDPEQYVMEHGLERVSDDASVRNAVERVLAGHPDAAADFRAGKEKSFGFLMGQTMRELQGKADPQRVRQLLSERLKNR